MQTTQNQQNANHNFATNNQENFMEDNNFHRLKKLTTHDLYRTYFKGLPCIAKLFDPSCQKNFEQEVLYFGKMNHPNILKMLYSRRAINPQSLNFHQRYHLILMQDASREDLNDYLPKYGKFNQTVARSIFKQIVEALNHAFEIQDFRIIHPNLLASSILLDENAQVKICGWSQIGKESNTQKLHNSIFACGEILICLVTSFMPFYKKNCLTDTFFKFVHPDSIHKFWNQITKKMKKNDKQFEFSLELKSLIQNIFFKKIINFKQILQSNWMMKGEILSQQNLKNHLEKNEKFKNEKLQEKKNKQIENEQKRKRILLEYQLSSTNTRCASDEEDLFVQDYEDCFMKQEEIPKVECYHLIKIEDTSPNFVIASLKNFLRSEKGMVSVILCEQFVLASHKVVKYQNFVVIELDFEMSQIEEEQEILDEDIISLKLKLSFKKNENKELYADISVINSNFSIYYTNLALRFLEDTIMTKKSCKKIEESIIS